MNARRFAYHQNTTRLFATKRHWLILNGMNFSADECEMTRVSTYRYLADRLNPDL